MDILKLLYMEHKDDDDDDDDDVSFAKWTSSFWGHSWIEEDERGLRDRRRSQDASYRKSCLPCPFPVLPRVMSSASRPRRDPAAAAAAAAAAASEAALQSCPTLCDPIDGNPPGSAVHGILQARVLEWVATAFSKKIFL